MKSRLFGRLPVTAVGALLAVTVGIATGPAVVLAGSPISYQDGQVVGQASQVVFNSNFKNKADANQVAGRYIVRFAEDSVPVHFANLSASGSTQSGGAYKAVGAQGRVRLNVKDSSVTAYAQSIGAQQTQHLKDIATTLGRTPTVSRMMLYALNAAVIEGLSADEASKIASIPGVVAVRPDILHPVATDIGPGFIGASSIWWNASAGQDTIFANSFDPGFGYRGDGIVIGDIDTGYNSLSPSFSATDDKGYTIQNPLGNGTYLGQCGVAGINLAGGCNNKVIGVYDELGAAETSEPTQYVEDSTLDGHGSHTGSTAGGNSRSATINNYTAELSGVAPHANMVIYRACYDDQCAESATVGSTDQAIQDGIVDALNYSISGGTDPWNDPTSLAFLSAADAGIFIAAAGGNTGTNVPVAVPGSVNHAEPWVTTAAASTHTGGPLVNSLNITGPATAPVVSLFATFTGSAYAGFTTAIPSSPLVVSPQFQNANTSGSDSCTAYSGTPFAGSIVVISRGTCNFSVKATNVQNAGAVAIVVADNRVEDVTQQAFTFSSTPVNIPAFFVSQSDGTALASYLTTNASGVTAAIPLVSRRYPTQPDVLAGFSLLGPASIDVIKPDIQAPGVNILAAVANDPNLQGPNSVAFYNGTSMATPHTTGTGALLLGLHPDWSPLEAKSAIMMTAKEVGLTKPDGVTPSTYFDRGSGRIQAFVASKAGLVLNETGLNFQNANPATGGNPSSLNLASLQTSSCITVNGSTSTTTCSFVRKFRSTQDHSVTWTPSFSGDVTATAPSFVVAAHANSQPITINVDATAYNSDGNYHFGELTLTPSDSTLTPLHLPLAIRVPPPTITATPSPLSINVATGTSGGAQLTVKNIGGPTLNVTNTNDTTSATSAVILDQPVQGNNGFYSTYWTDVGGGPYGADDFAVTGPSSNLSKLSFPGFVTGSGTLSTAGTKIHFEIYDNASGVPNGQPETASPSYRWHYVATVGTTPGLSVTGSTISINLAAAGAPPTALPAGHYWMVVYPELAYGTAGVGWAWFESGTTFGYNAQNIDPDQLFSGSTGNWTDNTLSGDLPSFAMHIEQAVACGAPWLSTTPSTLAIGGKLSAPLTVNVDSTAFNLGQTSASAILCLDSNDPANPVYAVPVTATVPNGGPQPPAVAKSFAPANVITGSNSTVTITLSNANAAVDTLTAALTDTLPSGLVATAGTAATTCPSGTASIGPGGTSIMLASGAQIPAKGSCTVTATVSAASVNTYTNVIAAGALQTDKGSSSAAASAVLTVTAAPIPPAISKAFAPSTVPVGTASTLTITLSNSNATVATLTSALTDTFPSGLVVASTPAASTTCGGTATVTATAGAGSASLSSGAQIPGSGSCTVTVNVSAAAANAYANTITAGALQTDAGNSPAAANATLTVNPLNAPTANAAFSPTSVVTSAPSTLTLTLNNSNAAPLTLSAALTTPLPSGLVVASTPNAATTCGGAVTGNAGDTSFSLASAGSSIPANGSCTVSISVQSATSAAYTATLAAGALQTNGGNNAAAASDNLIVTGTFPAPYCASTDSLSIEPITSVSFAGIVQTTPATVGTGGSAAELLDYTSVTGGAVAPRGGYTLSAKGNSDGNYTDYVNVFIDWNHDGNFDASEVTKIGAITNSTGTDSVVASGLVIVPPTAKSGLTRMRVVKSYGGYGTACGDNGYGQSQDYLILVNPSLTPPPVPALVSKAFAPTYLSAPGGISTLTITLTNYNSTDLPLTAALTDTFPSGLVVAATPNASTTCPSGTVTATPGSGSVTLSSGAIVPTSTGSCVVTVNVTSSLSGIFVNTIPAGAAQTALGNSPLAASATVQYASTTGLPTYSVGFESPFTVATLNGQQGWQGQGTNKVVATTPAHGLNAVTLTSTANGGVTGTQPLILSPVQNVGTSPYSSLSANIAISKLTNGASWEFDPQDSSEGLIVTSVVFDAATQSIEVIDFDDGTYTTLPAVGTWTAGTYLNLKFVVERATGIMDICLNGTSVYHDASGTSVAGNNITDLAVLQVAASGQTAANTIEFDDVVIDNQATGGCGSTTPPIAPSVAEALSAATVVTGVTSNVTLTLVNNSNSTAANLTAPFVDTLPTNLVVAATPTPATTCPSGSVTATTGGSTVTLGSGAQIPANGTCTVTFGVQSATAGSYVNPIAAGQLMTDEGSNVLTTTATLKVNNPPTVGLAFSPTSVATATASTLTITLTNGSTSQATISSAFVNTFPTGLVVATTPSQATTCTNGSGFTSTAGATSITLPANYRIPASGSCTVKVNVQSANAGSYVDTVAAGALVTNQGTSTAGATATLTVGP